MWCYPERIEVGLRKELEPHPSREPSLSLTTVLVVLVIFYRCFSYPKEHRGPHVAIVVWLLNSLKLVIYGSEVIWIENMLREDFEQCLRGNALISIRGISSCPLKLSL